MRVLVTGGTGVVGRGAVTALLQRGHQVRLMSRNARRDAEQWAEGVEPWPGDVSSPSAVRGSAEGCDAVLHAVGIVDESPPDVTFDKVNVLGTQLVLEEAARAGVARFVFVSSLGADHGASEYHASKRRAEALVQNFAGSWTIVRPGSVYGPGDEQISMLLKMIRTLPAIPVIGGGEHPFQPIWSEDLAHALALAVEREDLGGRILDIAGPEVTSQNDLIERLSRVTDRSPMRLPVPEFLTSLGIRLASSVAGDVPFNEDQLIMLREGNVIQPGRTNALQEVFGIPGTPLDEGLKLLADALSEQLPSEGIGALKRKRTWAEIRGSRYTRETLMQRFRQRFNELTPFYLEIGSEPGTSARLDEGCTVTMSLPMRGTVQVRVEEITDSAITLVTLDGHPLAGAVRFLFEDRGDAIRFEVQVYDRAATIPDLLMMRTVGALMQNHTWRQTVENVVEESGGKADGVEQETETLDDDQAERIERWVSDLVMQRRRESAEVAKA